MRLGVVFWKPDEGIAREAAQSFAALGHDVMELPAYGTLPGPLDLVFAYGPFGSPVPLGTQLLHTPPSDRPAFIFWQIEPLPNPAQPDWLIRAAARARSAAGRLAYGRDGDGRWQVRPGWKLLTTRAFRYRYIGDLLWLQGEGILSLLVVGSRPNGDFLRRFGLDPFQPPLPSFRAGWGADLALERDIPVLWLGKIATRRRRRALDRVRQDLRQLGVEMLVIDGVENPYIFGEERTRLLNRTRIVLNLLRNSWDSHAGRFQLAAMNRALLVSEPCLDHTGFTAGEHFVVAPQADLAAAVKYYLDHEEQRQCIADRAHDLILQTPRTSVYQKILEEALAQGV